MIKNNRFFPKKGAIIAILTCLLLILSACSSKEITDNPENTATTAPSEAPTITSDIAADNTSNDNSAADTNPGTPAEGAEGAESFDGYVGDVELDDGDHPLYVYDGITYAIFDDHAEVVYTLLSDDTVTDIVIRSEIVHEGAAYPVTVIEDFAFYCFTEAETVSFPEGLKSVGESAFEFCEKLDGVVLPESLESLGTYAFSECTSLSEISLPASVNTFGTGIFNNCTALETVTLSEGLVKVFDEMFSGCSSIVELVLPSTVTAIGNEAFYYCESLENVVLPEGLTVIGDQAFYNCVSLEEVKLPYSLSYLSEDAFDACDVLSTFYVPEKPLLNLDEILVGYDAETIVY